MVGFYGCHYRGVEYYSADRDRARAFRFAGRLGYDDVSYFTVYITNLIQQSNKRRKQYYEEEEQQKKASAQKESAEKAVVQKVNT